MEGRFVFREESLLKIIYGLNEPISENNKCTNHNQNFFLKAGVLTCCYRSPPSFIKKIPPPFESGGLIL